MKRPSSHRGKREKERYQGKNTSGVQKKQNSTALGKTYLYHKYNMISLVSKVKRRLALRRLLRPLFLRRVLLRKWLERKMRNL